jgi:hypothetical protein
MLTAATSPTPPITIPFVCPVCAGPNRVHLISLSRTDGMDCATCGRWLRSRDVMRAMHAPRAERNSDSAPIRHREPRRVALLAPNGTLSSAEARAIPPRRDRIVWPPTPATRAAAIRSTEDYP